MDITIQDLCPSCGVINVQSSKARLNIYSNGENRLTFNCPRCQLRVLHDITPQQYIQLYPNVARIYTDPPPEYGEVVRMERSPFTEVEVQEFVDDLIIYPIDRILKEAANGDHRT